MDINSNRYKALASGVNYVDVDVELRGFRSLRAVSLLLESPRGMTQNKWMCKRDDERDILTVSDGVGRRAKRDFVDRRIIELLYHLSAGLQKCCLKPLQSLFSFDFGGPSYLWFTIAHLCFVLLRVFLVDFLTRERLLATKGFRKSSC